MKYITKFDYAHTRGYQVRLPDLNAGYLVPYADHIVSRFFAKGKKPWNAVLVEAIAWRDDFLKKHNKLDLLENEYKHPNTRSPRNTSGVIGVERTKSVKMYGVYEAYTAKFMRDGKQVNRSFSINRYGECGAFLLACNKRFEHSGLLIITDLEAIPCLPDVDYTYENP